MIKSQNHIALQNVESFLSNDVTHPTGVGVADLRNFINTVALVALFIGAFPVHVDLFEARLAQ